MTIDDLYEELRAKREQGKGHYVVRYAEDPFTSDIHGISVFSISGGSEVEREGTLTLCSEIRLERAA